MPSFEATQPSVGYRHRSAGKASPRLRSVGLLASALPPAPPRTYPAPQRRRAHAAHRARTTRSALRQVARVTEAAAAPSRSECRAHRQEETSPAHASLTRHQPAAAHNTPSAL